MVGDGSSDKPRTTMQDTRMMMSDESKVKKHVHDLSTELCPMKTEENMYVCMYVCMHVCIPIIPVQRQGLVISLAVGIQGQKAYVLKVVTVVHDTASASNAFQLFTTLPEGVPSAVEARNLLVVNCQRMTSSSLIYFHLKKSSLFSPSNPLIILKVSLIALTNRAYSVNNML